MFHEPLGIVSRQIVIALIKSYITKKKKRVYINFFLNLGNKYIKRYLKWKKKKMKKKLKSFNKFFFFFKRNKKHQNMSKIQT